MSYRNEYQSALQCIDADNPDVRSLRFFLDTIAQWHTIFDECPDEPQHQVRPTPTVAVLGHGVPEQLVRACGTTPLHLMGGSHAFCQWSDDIMPRDSDPASRSTLGYALQLARRYAELPVDVGDVLVDRAP